MNVPGCQIFIGIKIKRLKWSYYIHHHLDTSCHPGCIDRVRVRARGRVQGYQAAAAAAVSCKNQGGSVLLQPPANTRLRCTRGTGTSCRAIRTQGCELALPWSMTFTLGLDRFLSLCPPLRGVPLLSTAAVPGSCPLHRRRRGSGASAASINNLT